MKKNLRVVITGLIVLSIYLLDTNLTAGIFMIEEDGSKTFIANGKLKEISEDEGMIMDSKLGDFIYFNPGNKIYTRGKISDFCESMNKIMEQMIASMPPESKKMLGVGEKQKPLKVEIVSECDGGTVAGYKTEKFNVLANGESHQTVWLATDASLTKEIKSLVGMLSEFQKCSKIMDFGAPPVELSPEYIKLMEKGMILKSVEYEEGLENTATNTVSIEIKNIPDSEFQVPVGYKEMSFTEYFSSQMGGDEEEF
jgi:hypothetical protein